MYFAVHGGTGRFCFFFEAGRGGGVFCRDGTGRLFFFPRRDGAVVFFPRRDGVAFFFFSTGRDGAVFFFFSRAETGRLFLAVAFFWRDGAKSLHRPAKKGGLNRPASRPCKALLVSLWVQHTHKHIFLILFFFRYFYIFACLVLGVIAAVCSSVWLHPEGKRREEAGFPRTYNCIPLWIPTHTITEALRSTVPGM